MPMRGIVMSASGRIRPKATTTPRSGARARIRSRNASSRIFAGWSTGIPCAWAISFVGVGCRRCPRPRGRSGCETTAGTRCGEWSSASSEGTANSGVPKKTITTPTRARSRLPLSRLPQLLNLADDQFALDAAKAIDENDAVEVVHLVLKRARQEVRSLDRLLDAVAIEALDHDALRPHHGGVEARRAQTAFFLELGPVAFDEGGIHHFDQLPGRLPDGEIDDEHAQGDADLRCRQPYARRGVHRFDHVVDEPPQRLVEAGDVRRAGVERLLAVSQDGSNHVRPGGFGSPAPPTRSRACAPFSGR